MVVSLAVILLGALVAAASILILMIECVRTLVLYLSYVFY